MKPLERNSLLARWHRSIGVAAALLVLILAVTGIALNHSSELGLDRKTMTAPWLMRWYGLTGARKLQQGYSVNGHWLGAQENRLFLDMEILPHNIEGLAGAVAADKQLAIAGATELLLLAEDGALIERITALPKPITGIGKTQQGRVAIRTKSGQVFTGDAALLDWIPAEDERGVEWAVAEGLPANIQDKYSVSQQGAGLSLERIVLDAHSGRIIGRFGPWLMDTAAVLLLILAVTGITGWWRGRNGSGGA